MTTAFLRALTVIAEARLKLHCQLPVIARYLRLTPPQYRSCGLLILCSYFYYCNDENCALRFEVLGCTDTSSGKFSHNSLLEAIQLNFFFFFWKINVK